MPISETNTKDNLGKPDEVIQFGQWDVKPIIGIEENSTIVETRDTDSTESFIMDTSLLNTGKLDDAADVTAVVVRVVNPNNTFREHFRDTEFESSGDMNWDTTNFRLSLE